MDAHVSIGKGEKKTVRELYVLLTCLRQEGENGVWEGRLNEQASYRREMEASIR